MAVRLFARFCFGVRSYREFTPIHPGSPGLFVPGDPTLPLPFPPSIAGLLLPLLDLLICSPFPSLCLCHPLPTIPFFIIRSRFFSSVLFPLRSRRLCRETEPRLSTCEAARERGYPDCGARLNDKKLTRKSHMQPAALISDFGFTGLMQSRCPCCIATLLT